MYIVYDYIFNIKQSAFFVNSRFTIPASLCSNDILYYPILLLPAAFIFAVYLLLFFPLPFFLYNYFWENVYLPHPLPICQSIHSTFSSMHEITLEICISFVQTNQNLFPSQIMLYFLYITFQPDILDYLMV